MLNPILGLSEERPVYINVDRLIETRMLADRDTIQSTTGYKSTSVYEFSRKLLARRLIVQVKPGIVRASEDLN